MIVVDAAAVPDHFSGARTRLRGLYGAYARLADAPPVAIRIARGSKLFDGVELGPIRVEEVERPGGPWRRAAKHTMNWRASERATDARSSGAASLLREATLWHSETIPPLLPRTAAAAPPTLLTIHDVRWSEAREVTDERWSTWWPRHLAARLWLPRLARSLSGIVTVSNWSARRIASLLGVPGDRVHVVANATELEPAPRLSADDESRLLGKLGVADRPFLLCVGHLEPRKGIELALAAFASSRRGAARALDAASSKLGSSAKLVLVGRERGGVGGGPLRRVVCRLGVDDAVVFAGELGERATSSLYARAAALLFPSRYEGFGLPVFEARACGCPVIARDLEVFGEARLDSVEWLRDDVEQWARAIGELDERDDRGRRSPLPLRRAWLDAARDLANVYARTTTPARPSTACSPAH